MMLKYSFGLLEEYEVINNAIQQVLDEGYRTGDIFSGSEEEKRIGTKEMGMRITEKIV